MKNILQRVNLVSQCCIDSSQGESETATEWINYLKTKLDQTEKEHASCQQHQNHLKMQIDDLLAKLAVAYASHPELQSMLRRNVKLEHQCQDGGLIPTSRTDQHLGDKYSSLHR